ncbi:uncharacterized protein FA14DRAFT_96250 [Meira miltonrushii]|uniref:Uncharacterized protein n=1 Tax=Meira miltonrushii TaxID=1280837 RepID=A0A316V1K4_9BASI|nr:uncharacterized protein FA14DRAFT_96250 [Meira miltonrushii]PWN31429.1 hypothetical protein FA14DRAFT_96250 [Meira miltonrushii]
MNVFYLRSLLIVSNVCVYGLPLEPGESIISAVTPYGGWIIGNLESGHALAESQKHQYHIEQKSEKFFLNPAKIAHHIKGKKALRNFEAHTKNVSQLGIAQQTGLAKVTRSKSGNKNHYEAVQRT